MIISHLKTTKIFKAKVMIKMSQIYVNLSLVHDLDNHKTSQMLCHEIDTFKGSIKDTFNMTKTSKKMKKY